MVYLCLEVLEKLPRLLSVTHLRANKYLLGKHWFSFQLKMVNNRMFVKINLVRRFLKHLYLSNLSKNLRRSKNSSNYPRKTLSRSFLFSRLAYLNYLIKLLKILLIPLFLIANRILWLRFKFQLMPISFTMFKL